MMNQIDTALITNSIFRYLKRFRFLPLAGICVYGAVLHGAVYAASAEVRFSGTVLPKAGHEVVSYNRTLVSFTDKVLLPLPGNADANDIGVFAGDARQQLPASILDLGSSGLAAMVGLGPATAQRFYMCGMVQGGCVRYTVLRME